MEAAGPVDFQLVDFGHFGGGVHLLVGAGGVTAAAEDVGALISAVIKS